MICHCFGAVLLSAKEYGNTMNLYIIDCFGPRTKIQGHIIKNVTGLDAKQ